MKRLVVVVMALLVLPSLLRAVNDNAGPIRPVSTYSIICYDSTTGQFGAAVQSHWFKVADVIWVEPNVGVVATQSLADFSYGLLGIEMMKRGKSARQTLEGILASDPENQVRQVAMMDKNGVIAAHTGRKCIAEAGHLVGKNYSVQANLMRSAAVWPTMAAAFENIEGDLAEKMMAALEAAQAEGGDIRGKQSAAMVVVTGEPVGLPWKDRIIDIRVDDSPEPLKELRRLLNVSRAYIHMDNGDEYVAVENYEAANREYARAADLMPDNPEIRYWHAVTLATVGQIDSALPIFKEVFAIDESWRELIPRLVKAELLLDDEELIDKIMNIEVD